MRRLLRYHPHATPPWMNNRTYFTYGERRTQTLRYPVHEPQSSPSEKSRRVREQVMNQKGYGTYGQTDLLYGQSSAASAMIPRSSFVSASSSFSTIEGIRRQCALWRSGPLRFK